ncbi:MAG: Gldg family protein [Gammaproteobacteria bacterium]
MSKRFITLSSLILAIVLFLAVNILASGTLTSWRMDMTDNKLFTLSEGTRNILKELEEPITLRYFFSQKMLNSIPNLKNYGARVRDMLEEYEDASNGKLKLIISDPEPFSELEDEAVSYGMRRLPVSNSGELAYFGLAGTNTTDDEEIISFFQPEKEQTLEYELTKMIYNLGNPKDRVIGVISTLPVFGQSSPDGRSNSPAWAVMDIMRGEYQVRDLGVQTSYIEPEIDTLLVIHPKSLKDKTLYAIDQFVLKGGKAIVFVDPMSETDETMPDPQSQMTMPERHSTMPTLFDKWGIAFDTTKVAGDIEASIRVQSGNPNGPQEIAYIPWMRLQPKHFNKDDFSTNQLTLINLGTTGFLQKEEGATTTFTPLISTSENSMAYERDAVIFVRDPTALLDQFESGGKPLLIAARINGKVSTAYPEGRPAADEKDPTFVSESKEDINLIVIADTDILADRFWVQYQNFMGSRVPTPHADNAKFILNSIDILGGSSDLISLRSRGQYSRPFDRVQDLQRQAEDQFRAREQALQQKLQEAEQRISQLQQQNTENSGTLLSPEQRKEIESFQQEQLKTRKELRSVQHDLKKNIEQLGTKLKFLNIGLIPILIGLLAIGTAVFNIKRRART